MTSPALLDRLWEAVKFTVFCRRDEYMAKLDGWEITEGAYGIRISKGPEFHWLPSGRLNKAAIRDCINPLIARYGYATTRTTDARQRRFNERIGFYRIGELGDETLYRIDALAF